ncbi:hypothetical protein GQX74_005050 [Glossina fuscipes]|nr:hypothetical protein GQX74_005050 [Glossina fuscipes]
MAIVVHRSNVRPLLLCFSPISMSLSSVLSAAVSSSSLSLYLRSPLSALLKPPKCVISRLHWSSYNLIVTIATIDQLARLATCLHTSSKVNVNNSSLLIKRAKCFKIFLAQVTQKQNVLKIQAFTNRNSMKKHERICTENWNIARNDRDSSEIIRILCKLYFHGCRCRSLWFSKRWRRLEDFRCWAAAI